MILEFVKYYEKEELIEEIGIKYIESKEAIDEYYKFKFILK